jgi:hypothetical protein
MSHGIIVTCRPDPSYDLICNIAYRTHFQYQQTPHAADKDLITGPGLPEAYRSHPARAVSVKMVNQSANSTLSHHFESPKMHERSIPRQILDYFLSIAVVPRLELRYRMSTGADVPKLRYRMKVLYMIFVGRRPPWAL